MTYASPELRIAAAYIRTATAGADQVALHRDVITAWCDRNGFTVPEWLWFIDEGVPGTQPFADRPEGGSLLRTVLERHGAPIPAIIATACDRAFRNILDGATVIEELAKAGTSLYFVADNP